MGLLGATTAVLWAVTMLREPRLIMRFSCEHAGGMSRLVQIRNVPEDMHRKLKSRAALAGLSLSDYLLQELRRGLDRPTRQELLERLSRRKPVALRRSPSSMVRSERGRR